MFLSYTAIFFVTYHDQTNQSSKYRDREGYLMEVCGKTTHHEIAMFLLDASIVRCVTVSKRANRTRKFWTTCCCRRVMTSGFCLRSKVHWGLHSTAHQGRLQPILYPMTLDYPEHLNIIGTATTTQHHTTTAHCSPFIVRVLSVN